ncbi:hypothetical protein HHK36_027345 [Tetracentron sinense]|uniref:Uncharacterized protein n=1 Tax=Tetracentron sinense TaxID=13715 RepID=A0A834YGL1_TETSI|nr:hypothetical protein HHK36_027345 [Tetracentron sinense]
MWAFSVSPLLLFIVFGICSPLVRSDAILLSTDDNLCAGAGAGSSSSACPVNCFRADPVCGVDGVTYWCGCADAICSGTRVAKFGFCEVGNGGNGPTSGQALLLVHIVWLILLGISVLFGLL